MSEVSFTVTVTTGAKGTNADIEILLIGTKGAWKEYQLMDGPGDDFEPHQTNVFKFYEKDIGGVSDIAIRPRGAGLYHDNWDMKELKVTASYDPSKTSTFIRTPRFKGGAEPILIRANEYMNTALRHGTVNEEVAVRVVSFENFLGLNTMEEAATDELVEVDKYTVQQTDKLNTKNSFELTAATKIEGIVDVSATYRGEIATEFSTIVTKARETMDKKTKTFKLVGNPGFCTFYVIRDMETKVYGEFEGGFGRAKVSQVLRKYQVYTQIAFRAVDEMVGNKTLQEYWDACAVSGPVPTAPTLADLEKPEYRRVKEMQEGTKQPA
ncbi:MAG: hypothetical protein H6585_11605 [Flavobacteriales bacterium]|nr:hypothetical protein [Flavobacteriales bacterium]MCB9448978.1 hypothetical protein [Flavobacteriales bacterium]